MLYVVEFSKRASKKLEKISEPFYSNIKEAVLNLAENPRPNGYKKLKGIGGYRIRIGDYRVVYDIFEDVLVIEVITVGHRKDVYQ